jgi:putative copper export protein
LPAGPGWFHGGTWSTQRPRLLDAPSFPRALVGWDTVRLFLHVLAATIWVGGQVTLAALVPVLRRLGAEIPRAAARRFNLVAWPAFGVLVITGIWNIVAVRSQIHGSYEITLWVKLIVVAISGVTAALHARARTAPWIAPPSAR